MFLKRGRLGEGEKGQLSYDRKGIYVYLEIIFWNVIKIGRTM